MYPHRFTNIHEFVQRVALDIVQYGYWFYVTGVIPEDRDPVEVDEKLIDKYDIGVSKWTRARRKKKGQANVHYVRHQRFFVMLASKGAHAWFEHEERSCEQQRKLHGRRIQDVRHKPISHGGYSISYKECSGTERGHVAVRIHPEEYRALKDYMLELSCRRSVTKLSEEFRFFPFEPYAGVRQQRWNILRAVNGKRAKAGFAPIDPVVLRKKRRVFKLVKPSALAALAPQDEAEAA